MLKVALEGILNFVKGGDLLVRYRDENHFIKHLKHKGAFDKIGELVGDVDDEVSQRATEIISMF